MTYKPLSHSGYSLELQLCVLAVNSSSLIGGPKLLILWNWSSHLIKGKTVFSVAEARNFMVILDCSLIPTLHPSTNLYGFIFDVCAEHFSQLCCYHCGKVHIWDHLQLMDMCWEVYAGWHFMQKWKLNVWFFLARVRTERESTPVPVSASPHL